MPTTETMVTNFKVGAYEFYIFVRKAGGRVVGFVVAVFKEGKQLLRKFYPEWKKALTAFDNFIEKAIKEVSGKTVDVPIVPG